MILNNNSTQQINTLLIQLQNRITNSTNEFIKLNDKLNNKIDNKIDNLDSKISDLEKNNDYDVSAMNAKIKANTEAISGKADKNHTHIKSEITDFDHTHDDRYYTESEVDTKLSGKADKIHTHTKSQITDFPTSLKNPNALTVNGKTYDGSSAVNAGVQTVANGGTGATTATQAINNLAAGFGLAGSSANGRTWGLDLTEWDDKIAAHSDSSSMCLVKDAQGFETTGNAGNIEPYCTKVYAQDHYSCTGSSKIAWVDSALKAASELKRNTVDITAADGTTMQATERCWSINYTSCTQNNPFTAARVVNEHLYKSPYINPDGTEETEPDYLKHIGIIASDFVDAALARSIYQRNYDTEHKQTASYHLPTRMRMTYGDSPSDASLQDGKTVGKGYFRLVDSSNVLNVAASGHVFEIVYVDVDALGNETVTALRGSVPIDIDPRALTPHFKGLEGLKAGEDVRAKITASLEGKLENDACTAQLEFMHDANGAPGTAMAEGEAFAAGTYWVRAKKDLLGDAAQNYTLASDGAASFTVAASDSAGGAGSNAGSANKNGKGNKGKGSGGKLADTGDGSGIAAGLAAAAIATTVAGAAMLVNDREDSEGASE